jgi:hypothetical protein
MERAMERIVALGGSCEEPPSLYPRPRSRGDEPPVLDWAAMQDPFGNDFCLVSEMTQEQIEAVREATEAGASTDHEWRAAAGLTWAPARR